MALLFMDGFSIRKEMNPKLRTLSVRRDPRQCWTIVRLEPVNLNLFSFETNLGLEINISMMNHTPELRSLGPIGTVVYQIVPIQPILRIDHLTTAGPPCCQTPR